MDRVLTRSSLALIARFLPFGYYVAMSGLVLAHYVAAGDAPGYDGWLYREAAATWLSGGDPWSIGVPGAHYAGAPSSFMVYAPSLLLPGDVWRWVSVFGSLALIVAILHRLRLPLYWLAYPPIVSAVVLGQPGILTLALLLFVPALAPAVKAFAIFPLAVMDRRKAVIASGLVLAAMVLVAPGLWLEWVSRLPELSARLAAELHQTPDYRLVAAGAVALVIVWWRDRETAGWLSIAALWPTPEYHYAIFALPTRNPWLLAGLALVAGQWTVIAYAAWVLARDVLPGLLARPMARTTGSTR